MMTCFFYTGGLKLTEKILLGKLTVTYCVQRYSIFFLDKSIDDNFPDTPEVWRKRLTVKSMLTINEKIYDESIYESNIFYELSLYSISSVL